MKQIVRSKEQHLTVNDIAEYCMVSGITVRRWIKGGKLSAMKLPSGHYRITTTGFRDFLGRYNMPIKEEFFKPE
jgi:excisionase family DNA binding protein